MYPCEVGTRVDIYAVFVSLVLEWTFTSSSQSFGTIDMEEFDHLGYVLEIAGKPVTTELASETLSESREMHWSMVSKNGQEYSCLLPSRQPTKVEDMAIEVNNAGTFSYNISKLLDPLSQMCLFLQEGWWTYRYCHGQHVSQFHVEAGEIEHDIVYLGHFLEEENWDGQLLLNAMRKRLRESSRASKPKLTSHNVFYTNGTPCGLTGKSRTTTAKLICSQADVQDSKIVKIMEGVTCNYSIIIHTPLLCSHPAFKPRMNRDSSPIVCSPVVSLQQYHEYWEQERASEAEVETQPDSQSNTLEHSRSTDELGETNKPVSLSLLLEYLAQSIAGKIEAEVMASETGEFDETQLEELMSDYAKESVEDIFERATFTKQFLVEKIDGDEDGTDREEERQARDQKGSLQSKETEVSSQQNGLPSSTERTEVAATHPTDTKDKTSHSEVLMKVYQVEIDPDEELDPENLQDMLAQGEEEGDFHEVKLDLTRDDGAHVGNNAFLDKWFAELLSGSAGDDYTDNSSLEKKKQEVLEEEYKKKWDKQHKRDKANRS